MATYYVAKTGTDSAPTTGAIGDPWLTLNYAYGRISAGDKVIVRTGTYSERLTIAKANTTWEAYTGETVIIDGGYSLSTCRESGTSWRDWEFKSPDQVSGSDVQSPGGGQIVLSADGITLDGLTIQHSGGRGINVGAAANATIQNCNVHFCYEACITANPPNASDADGLLIDSCVLTMSSMMYYDKQRATYMGQGEKQFVQGIIKLKVTNGTVRDTYGAYGFGEGFNIGKGADGITVEGCTVHDTLHKHYYINGADNVVIRRCLSYCSGHPATLGYRDNDDEAPAGFAVTSEVSRYQTDVAKIYNCISINDGKPIQIGTDTTLQATNIYIGGNTIIAGPNTDRGIWMNDGTDAQNTGLFENNVIDYRYAPDEYWASRPAPGRWLPLTITAGSYSGGFKFRNNLWSELPPAKFRGDNDLTGDPGVVRANAPITMGELPTSAGVVDTFDLTPYQLKDDSVCVDAGADGSTLKVDPPDDAYTEDYNQAGRTAPVDLGALENGATVGTLTASFTTSPSPASGTAPLSVTFTSTSSSSGTITKYIWDFGDGTTPVEDTSPTTHIYAEPGTYTARLTVYDDNSRVKTATAAVTVTTQASVSNVIIDVVEVALNTSTGAQAIALSLGGQVPKAAVFMVTTATADNTNTDHAMIATGLWAANGAGRCDVWRQKDGATGTDGWRAFYEPGVIATLDASGALDGFAQVSGRAANEITINITDAFPSAYKCVVMAWAGTDVHTYRRTVELGATDTTTTVSTERRPMAFLASSVWAGLAGTVEDGVMYSFGLGAETATDNIFDQYALAWQSDDAVATTAPSVKASGGRLGFRVDAASAFSVDSVDEAGATFRVARSNLNSSANVLMLNFNGNVEDFVSVRSMLTPDATGDVVLSTDWQPAAMLAILNQTVDESRTTGNLAGSGGVYLFDGTDDYSVGWAETAGVTTTDTVSRVSDSLLLLDHTKSTLLAGSTAFDVADATLTFSTVSALPRYWPVMLFVTGATPTTPTADFTVDTHTPDVDETVTFTDLSTGNGNTITAWAWDFGDGDTSTDQNPTHSYVEPGEYSVSLTVTTSGGTDTETKSRYIRVGASKSPGYRIVIGPPEPLTITNTSINYYVADPDVANARGLSHKLDLDALLIDAAGPDSWDTVNGKLKLGIDAATKKLKLVLPTGQIGFLTVDWQTAPNDGGGGGTTATVERQVSTSSNDALEISTTVTLTDNYLTLTGNLRWVGLRFLNVPIPQGATITAATLSVYVPSTTYDDPNGTVIYAEDIASAPNFTTDTSDIGNRTVTTASVTWTGTAIGTGWQDSPEIKTVIQEVVSRTDWAAGNAIAILLDGVAGSDFRIVGYDYRTDQAAKLTITYTS